MPKLATKHVYSSMSWKCSLTVNISLQSMKQGIVRLLSFLTGRRIGIQVAIEYEVCWVIKRYVRVQTSAVDYQTLCWIINFSGGLPNGILESKLQLWHLHKKGVAHQQYFNKISVSKPFAVKILKFVTWIRY